MEKTFRPSESFFQVDVKKIQSIDSENEDVISIIFYGLYGFLNFEKHLESRLLDATSIKDCESKVFLLQRKAGEENKSVQHCFHFIQKQMKSVCSLSRLQILEALLESVSHFLPLEIANMQNHLQKIEFWSFSFKCDRPDLSLQKNKEVFQIKTPLPKTNNKKRKHKKNSTQNSRRKQRSKKRRR